MTTNWVQWGKGHWAKSALRSWKINMLLAFVALICLTVFGCHAYQSLTYGEIVATKPVLSDSTCDTIRLRERNNFGLMYFIADFILPGRSSEYLYWIEVCQNGKVMKVSWAYRWDSIGFDSPLIENITSTGVNVLLDGTTRNEFVWMIGDEPAADNAFSPFE